MKRWLGMVAIFAGGVGIALVGTTRGQFGGPPQSGPGDKGAILRNPLLDPSPTMPSPMPQMPSYVPKSNPLPGSPFSSPGLGAGKIALPPSNPVHLIKEYEITPEAGPFTIFVMAYSGPEAPVMAKKFVEELRGNYKIPQTYVYNYGAKEKQAEYERVQKIRKEYQDALDKADLKTNVLPIRVPVMRIDEQTGVLVGGFKSYDDAANALKKVRVLPPPNPQRVAMNMTQAHEEYFDPKTGKPLEKNVVAKSEYVNPFSKAFVARNPTVQFEKSPEFLAEEVKFLRRVNADESFSLFNCKKAVTLAIKKYDTPHRVTGDEKESKGGFFSVFQGSRSMTIDHTAHNAHNLAEALRKGGLPETYVLHCRYCSYVTVGGFDSEKDDRIAAMQTFLENRFRNDAFRPLDLFPRPVPMQVPR